MFGRGKIGENRRVLYRDLLLVIVTVRYPSLDLGTIERSGDEPSMKGVLIMIALVADGAKPGDEARAGGRDLRLELRVPSRRRQIGSHLSAERTLLKIGTFPACFLHAISLSQRNSIHYERVFA
jgi:hypothetical protein